MAQDLQTTAEPLLPALDLSHPQFLGQQPPWLASRITAESRSENRRILRDATGRHIGEVRTLPRSLMLTGAMRAALSHRVTELEAALEPGPIEGIMEHVTRLLARYLRHLPDDELAVRAETYVDALDDLPAWTIREACRRWFKGQCGGEAKDYNFAPAEARLYQIARQITRVAEGQLICFRRVLAAEAEPQITDADRERQAAALRTLASSLGATRPPPAPELQPAVDRSAIARQLEERRIRRLAQEAAEAAQADVSACAAEAADENSDGLV